MSDIGNRLKRKKKRPPKETPEPALRSGAKSDIIAQLQKKMDRITSSVESNDQHGAIARSAKADTKTQAEDTPGQQAEPEQSAFAHVEQPAPPAGATARFSGPTSEAPFPGHAVETNTGEVWVNKEVYRGYCHGNEPVASYLETGEALSVLGRVPRLKELPPSGALFVDTETTGLSGGSGTLPFLVGVGWFEGDDFVVEHLFCRDPSEEEAQLELLAAHMARAEYLVSFNGKSFDLPLINTRFIINRVKNPGFDLPHLDLLHVARRIFGRRLNDRSLQNLEKVILEFRRHGDIPGAQIPETYINYLNGTDTQTIATVLEHNSLDILALAALGGVLDRMYKDPEAVAHAADSLGLARAALRVGAVGHAGSHLAHADETGMGDDRQTALHMTARSHARQKEHHKARDAWHKILEDYPDDPFAHLCLAKYYEHKQKDFGRAMDHARKGAQLEGEEGSAHRLLRLQRKKDKKK